MTTPQRFCTACGTPVPGMRFCSQCGQPVAVLPAADTDLPQTLGGKEQILGIIPILEQGLLSVIHYILIITNRRLIFCTWDPSADEPMSDAGDAMMQESCSVKDTTDEIAHFRQKNWSAGPWQRYLSLEPDAIIAGAPGTITVPLLGEKVGLTDHLHRRHGLDRLLTGQEYR